MKRRTVLILLILAAAMLFGILERESVLVQDAMQKDSITLHIPLPCDARVSQRGAGEPWVTRCYFSPSDKGKQ